MVIVVLGVFPLSRLPCPFSPSRSRDVFAKKGANFSFGYGMPWWQWLQTVCNFPPWLSLLLSLYVWILSGRSLWSDEVATGLRCMVLLTLARTYAAADSVRDPRINVYSECDARERADGAVLGDGHDVAERVLDARRARRRGA